MKDPIIVASSSGRAGPGVDHESGWKVLFLLGAALMVVGLVDAVLLVIPSPGVPLDVDWELNIVSGVIDGMPLITIGIGAMLAASMVNGGKAVRRLMVALTLLVTVIIAVLGLMFVLDVSVAMKSVAPANRWVVKKAALKTGLMAATYFVLYLSLGVWTWRRLRVRT